MDRQDRARPRVDRRFDPRRVDRQPPGSMSAEHRPRAGHHDRERACSAADSGVVMTSSPGADAERAQRSGRSRRCRCRRRPRARAPASRRRTPLRTPRLPARARTSRCATTRSIAAPDVGGILVAAPATGTERGAPLTRRSAGAGAARRTGRSAAGRSRPCAAGRRGSRTVRRPAGRARELATSRRRSCRCRWPSCRPASRRTRRARARRRSISSAVRSRWLIGSSPPTLNTSPLHASLAPARRNASAASST